MIKISKQFHEDLEKIYKKDLEYAKRPLSYDIEKLKDEIDGLLPQVSKQFKETISGYVKLNYKVPYTELHDFRKEIVNHYPFSLEANSSYLEKPEYQIYLKLRDIESFYSIDPSYIKEMESDFEKITEKLTQDLNLEIDVLNKKLSNFKNIDMFLDVTLDGDNIGQYINLNNLSFTLRVFEDTINYGISYSLTDGNIVVNEMYEDIFEDEEDVEKASNYISIVKILSNEKIDNIQLYRYMSNTEYAKWDKGELIPSGKFFTSVKTIDFAPDFSDTDHDNSNLYTFLVQSDNVVKTDRNVYRLIKDSILDGKKIIPKLKEDSVFKSVYNKVIESHALKDWKEYLSFKECAFIKHFIIDIIIKDGEFTNDDIKLFNNSFRIYDLNPVVKAENISTPMDLLNMLMSASKGYDIPKFYTYMKHRKGDYYKLEFPQDPEFNKFRVNLKKLYTLLERKSKDYKVINWKLIKIADNTMVEAVSKDKPLVIKDLNNMDLTNIKKEDGTLEYYLNKTLVLKFKPGQGVLYEKPVLGEFKSTKFNSLYKKTKKEITKEIEILKKNI